MEVANNSDNGNSNCIFCDIVRASIRTAALSKNPNLP